MNRYPFANFRHRLLLLVLLAVLPALGLMLYTADEQRRLAASNAQEEALRFVRLASNNHEHLIKETEQLLSVMAQLPEVRDESYDSCSELFSRLQKQYPLYTCFGIIKPDGKLQCVVPTTSEQINLFDRPYFQSVIKTHDFAVGDLRISRVTDKASIHFAYPVMNEFGQVKSVLFAELNMDWLNKLAVKVALPPGVTLTVIDRNGTVLSRHPDADKWVGRAMYEVAVIKTVLNKKTEGTTESIGMDGVSRFYAYMPLSGSAEGGDMYIYTGMPTAKAYAGANRLLGRNLAGIGLITLLVLTIAWFGGNLFFIRGVKALLAATDRLANGDLSARTGISYGKGELCQLARNFDNMAGALEQRTEQLYRAEIKYRTLVEAIPAVTYIVGLDNLGVTQYVSPQIKELLGFAPEELVTKADFRLQQISTGEFLNALAIINTGCNVGETFHFEYPLLAKDGSVVWVHDEARVIWDETAQHRLLQGFLLDITKRKKAEESLERLSRRQELILSSAGEGIFGLNIEGKTTFVNPAAAKMLGYEVWQLINQPIHDLCHHKKPDGSYYPEERCPICAAYKDGLIHHVEDEFFWRSDGTGFPVEYVSTPMQEKDELVGAVVVFKDITERKTAEEAMAKSRDFYLTLFEEFPALIWRAGIDGKCNHFNKSWLNFTGRTMEQEMGEGWTSGVHPEDLDKCVTTYLNAFNSRNSFEMEYRLCRYDGEYRWIVDFGRPFSDQEGNFAGFIGSCYDITERKQIEAQICRVAARAEALAKLLQAMAEAGLNYHSVLDTVARKTAKLLGDACVICLLSDDEKWLKPTAYYHTNPLNFNIMRNVFNSIDQYPVDGLMSSIIHEGKSVFIPVVEPELASTIIMPKYHRYLEQCGIHSLLIVPLRVQGRVIGSLGLSKDKPGLPYNEDDHFFTQDLANRVSLALTNARLYDENLRQLKELSALYMGAEKLIHSLDLRELAGDVTRTCVELFGVSLAYLGRVEAGGRMFLLNQYPPDSDFPHRVFVRRDSLSPGQGLTDQAIQSGLPVIINDVVNDPILEPWREIVLAEGLSTCAAFPLINREKSFGTLNLCSVQDDYFTPERIEFFQAFTHMVAATLENARLFEEAGRRLKHVEALRNIDMAITSSLDLRVTFSVVMDQVLSQLGIDAAVILLLNPYAQTFEYAAGRGFRTRDVERTCRRLGEGNAGHAAQERRIVHIPNLKEAGDDCVRSYIPAIEKFISCYSVPLIAKGQVKGVLEIFQRNPFNPDQEWLDFLETLAGQAAIAIDNAGLFNELQRSNDELRLAYDATIEGWAYALDLRDKETEGHSRRVTEVTLRLARAMDVSDADLIHVRRGALLHDIGKMGVPDHILLKPGPLTEDEWKIMRLHPVYAFEMLSPINYLHSALDIPYCHHEKWDGTGYPRGLKGVQIPLAARIFAVIDVWDALCSDRPYRPAWPEAKVHEFIREQSGKHFDPQVVKRFLAMENYRETHT